MRVVQAVAWQIYGCVTAVIFSLSLLAEALWWTFFFRRQPRARPWLVHVFMAVSALALFHYERTRHKREQVLDVTDAAARLGRSPSFFIAPFRVKIEIAFFAFPALFGVMTGNFARAGFFVVSSMLAVLAHELAHAAAARINNHEASITLNLLAANLLITTGRCSRADNTSSSPSPARSPASSSAAPLMDSHTRSAHANCSLNACGDERARFERVQRGCCCGSAHRGRADRPRLVIT